MLLEWGLSKTGLATARHSFSETTITQVLENNMDRRRLLSKYGFARESRHYTVLERDIGTVEASCLPAGFYPASGPDECMVDAYVSMHRMAWGEGSTYSVEMHRHLQTCPGYNRELNPVIITVDGRIAGSCICWLDEFNLVGEIESLQIAPDFRKLGFGKALLSEAFIRVRRFITLKSLVYSASVNVPAERLYASAGFMPVGKILVYSREA